MEEEKKEEKKVEPEVRQIEVDIDDIKVVEESEGEKQLIAEIQGEIVDKFVYSFCKKHKAGEECNCPVSDKVFGLTYSGVKQVILEKKNVLTELVSFTETDTHFRVMFKATDVQSNISAYGGSEQPKKMFVYRQNGYKTDDTAYQKCITKAQRNAWRNLLPETTILELVKKYKQEEDGVKDVGSAEGNS